MPNPSDPTPAASGRAADDLGQGWKVRPFLRVNKGQTATLMDVDGPGVIQHIWMVEGLSRANVLRFYWDGETTPSIEVPAPDFFAVGHGKFATVNSLAVVVNPDNALNCYWPMPFRKHVRVTLSNESPDQDLTLLAYQIDYAETEVPANAAYFHAQFRRARTDRQNPYVILDGVRGHGPLRRHLSRLDAALQGLVRRGGDQVLHRRRQGVPHDLRHGDRRLLLRQLWLPASFQRPLHGHDAAGQRRTPSRPASGACTAGTSWTQSASSKTCGSPSRRWVGRAASTRSSRTTWRRSRTGIRPFRTRRSPRCRR